MSTGYNIRKAAQVAAFFAQQEGGTINVLKLVKLIYLADREYMAKYDEPILFDEFVSMPHGPVNSQTLHCINGLTINGEIWEQYISDKADHQVGLKNPNISEDELDELSDAELDTLHKIWIEFGKMSKYEIRDYTHEHCPEWENPHGSSAPIPYERVFKFLGKNNSSELAERIDVIRSMNEALSIAE